VRGRRLLKTRVDSELNFYAVECAGLHEQSWLYNYTQKYHAEAKPSFAFWQKRYLSYTTAVCCAYPTLSFQNILKKSNTYITIFMVYFIHGFLANMFRPVFLPSSGWSYCYKNTKRQVWLTVSPSLYNSCI